MFSGFSNIGFAAAIAAIACSLVSFGGPLLSRDFDFGDALDVTFCSGAAFKSLGWASSGCSGRGFPGFTGAFFGAFFAILFGAFLGDATSTFASVLPISVLALS